MPNLRAVVLPAADDGPGRYRLIWPAEYLRTQGCQIELRNQLQATWERHYGLDPRLVGAAKLDADVVVVQRTLRPDMLLLLRSLREQGLAVVIDLDDDLAGVDPRHPMYAYMHPKLTRTGGSWQVTREICRLADMVTVSTPALAARYGGHGRVRIVRNGVRRSWLAAEHDESDLLGWTGTPRTHIGDLDMARDAVREVIGNGLARFLAIGDPQTLTELGVDGETAAWSGLQSMGYPEAISRLAVGIVPLRLTAFNESKSAIKGLEMAARGVPFVASPTSEYRRLQTHGAGLLAERPREWLRQLRRLLGSADLRLALGAKGRSVAASHTLEETTAPQLWAAWQQARENRGKRAA